MESFGHPAGGLPEGMAVATIVISRKVPIFSTFTIRDLPLRVVPAEVRPVAGPESDTRREGKKMKQITVRASMERCGGKRLRTATLFGTVCLAAWGCSTGDPQTEIPGVRQSAPFLAEFNARGDYEPYFTTAEMNTPRYWHDGLLSVTGKVIVIGGSDERGFNSLDSIEIFDQSTRDKDEPAPDTGAGIWIDTNFEGDQMVMPSGGRMLFTADELSDNSIVIIGGTQDLFTGTVRGKVEIFDPDTRMFEVGEEELLTPRFFHTTTKVGNGDLLVTGGQGFTQVNLNPFGFNFGVFGGQQRISVFASTPEIEVFSPKDSSVSEVNTISGSPSELQTQRGRAGHAMERIAGPDNRLNTSDDIFMMAGGLQTLSAQSGRAPTSKLPGTIANDEADGVTTIEVFDPLTNIFTLIASVRLNSTRVYFPEIVNLGKFNDFTPDGVRGMGNALLITNGNNDEGALTTPLESQLFLANYVPGGGPAQGVRFFEVEEQRFLSLVENTEYPGNPFPARGIQVARCATNTVSLPRPVDTVQGVTPRGTWVFALAGVDLFPGAANYDSAAMLSGCVFDPLFSQRAAFLFNLDPTDLENERRSDPQNFLGIVGTWMTIDSAVSLRLEDFGTTPQQRWAERIAERRVFLKAVPLPGVDGRPSTFDDRILLSGGGIDYFDFGGELTSPSAEVFLPPGSSQQ